jgi:hypothetical protein
MPNTISRNVSVSRAIQASGCENSSIVVVFFERNGEN